MVKFSKNTEWRFCDDFYFCFLRKTVMQIIFNWIYLKGSQIFYKKKA